MFHHHNLKTEIGLKGNFALTKNDSSLGVSPKLVNDLFLVLAIPLQAVTVSSKFV